MASPIHWKIRKVQAEWHRHEPATMDVFMCLWSHGNRRNRTWPSNATVKDETGWSNDNVNEALKFLNRRTAIIKIPYNQRTLDEVALPNNKNIWELTGYVYTDEGFAIETLFINPGVDRLPSLVELSNIPSGGIPADGREGIPIKELNAAKDAALGVIGTENTMYTRAAGKFMQFAFPGFGNPYGAVGKWVKDYARNNKIDGREAAKLAVDRLAWLAEQGEDFEDDDLWRLMGKWLRGEPDTSEEWT